MDYMYPSFFMKIYGNFQRDFSTTFVTFLLPCMRDYFMHISSEGGSVQGKIWVFRESKQNQYSALFDFCKFEEKNGSVWN